MCATVATWIDAPPSLGASSEIAIWSRSMLPSVGAVESMRYFRADQMCVEVRCGEASCVRVFTRK